MSRLLNQWIVASSAIITLAVAVPVQAEQPQERAIEEIVVTAQKRVQSTMDVPQAVQAISGEELERNRIAGFSDLVEFIPGASVVSSTAPGFETIQMRGIASGTTGDATVGYYIDDVAFGVPNLQLAPPARLFDLERVEVLRGPQGTLYGQGSMGGTVKLLTATPDSREFSARSRVTAEQTKGGDPGYSGDVMVNVPLAEDKLAVRLTGGIERMGGWVDSPDVADDDLNEADLWNVRLKALYTPTQNLDVTATYWKIDSALDGANTFSRRDPATGNEWTKPTMAGTGGEIGFIDTQLDMYSVLLNWQLPFATLVSATSYTEHELDFVFPLFTAGFQFYNDSTFKTDAVAQELRLLSSEDNPVKWLVGGFYRDATIESDIDFFLDLGSGTTIPLIDTYGEILTESWSVFGEASIELFDGRVEPLIGLRYFEDDRTTANGVDRTTGAPRPPVGDVYDAVTPRFALMVRPSDEGMVFVNVAKGFRSGTTQTDAQVQLAAQIGVPTAATIDPDEVWTYELGAKWRFLDGAMLLDTAVYYMEWDEIQLQFSVPGTIALANGGDAEIQGFDLALQWLTPVEGLSLQISGNVSHAVFTNVNPNLAAATVTVGDGRRIPNSPRRSATLAARYEWAMTGGREGFVNAVYAYRDRQIDAGSGLESGILNRADLSVGVRSDKWQASLFADNLNNEQEPVVRTGTGVQFITPRRIGLQFVYDL